MLDPFGNDNTWTGYAFGHVMQGLDKALHQRDQQPDLGLPDRDRALHPHRGSQQLQRPELGQGVPDRPEPLHRAVGHAGVGEPAAAGQRRRPAPRLLGVPRRRRAGPDGPGCVEDPPRRPAPTVLTSLRVRLHRLPRPLVPRPRRARRARRRSGSPRLAPRQAGYRRPRRPATTRMTAQGASRRPRSLPRHRQDLQTTGFANTDVASDAELRRLRPRATTRWAAEAERRRGLRRPPPSCAAPADGKQHRLRHRRGRAAWSDPDGWLARAVRRVHRHRPAATREQDRPTSRTRPRASSASCRATR
jgi:hypothetical protein